MKRKSTKLTLTTRGKITLIALLAFIVLASFGISSYFIHKSSENKISAEKTYAYSMNMMLEQAKTEEQAAREELDNNLKNARTLLDNSSGKVFDGSRSNLQIYVNNISDVPEAKKINSTNINDYVASTKRVKEFNNSLLEKYDALNESYTTWRTTREKLDQESNDLQQQIDEGTITVSELEKLLANKQQEGEEAARERDELLRLLEQQKKNTQPVKPTTSVEKPSTPTEKPTTIPTSPTPTAPTPTNTPTEKQTPTETPTKKPTTPTTTTPSPTEPTKTPEEAPEGSVSGNVVDDNDE